MPSVIFSITNGPNGEISDVQDLREVVSMSLRYTEDPQNPGSYIEATIYLRFKKNFVKHIHYTNISQAQNDFNNLKAVKENSV